MRSPKQKFAIRKNRVRTKISKCSTRYRLSIFKSNRHIYCQIIDDVAAKTLVNASTLTNKNTLKAKCNYVNKTYAKKLGESLANKASALGIKEVVLDRGGCKYHGIIKDLADKAREKLIF